MELTQGWIWHPLPFSWIGTYSFISPLVNAMFLIYMYCIHFGVKVLISRIEGSRRIRFLFKHLFILDTCTFPGFSPCKHSINLSQDHPTWGSMERPSIHTAYDGSCSCSRLAKHHPCSLTGLICSDSALPSAATCKPIPGNLVHRLVCCYLLL